MYIFIRRMLYSDAIILFEKEGFRPFSIIVIAEHKANIGEGDVLQLAKYTIAERVITCILHNERYS